MNLVNEIKEIVKNEAVEVPKIRDELQKKYPKADSNKLRDCIILISEIDEELLIDKSKTIYKYFAVKLK